MKEDFRNWLIEHKQYGRKAAGDVISRLVRANAICAIDLKRPSHRTLNDLSQIDKFAELSVSVRCQLRRSIKLFYEYSQTL